jgi:hypothetical protein
VSGPLVHFPLGEFVCANSKKVGADPTFSRRIISLTNHIAKIRFSLRENSTRTSVTIIDEIYLSIHGKMNNDSGVIFINSSYLTRIKHTVE